MLSISGCDSVITSDIRPLVVSQNKIYNHFSLHFPNVRFSEHQMAVTQRWWWGVSVLLRARGRACECKITPKTTPKEERRWRKRVGGKWEMERGCPGGCSKNLLRYFLQQTQKLRYRTERGVPIHTHIHKIQHVTLKIHSSGQQYNFDLTHSWLGRSQANFCFPVQQCLPSTAARTHTPT